MQNNINMNNKKVYNNLSIWYDRNGVDEMYVAGCDEEFDQKFIDRCSEEFEWLKGVKREDFYEEVRGDKWIMFGSEGIGVLCSDINVETAHDEYENWCD
jgi:hypothetical protein